ncbi:A/G-specific adenine glycosylase [Flavobacterium sp.]|uniref:A/G-specific adenine glycosylase n=1 Tax=Flavobacterium sp. TaxID=239 RepID=UPI002628C721|nr:A/G-specific adenine glycosylase [Flavobacterium sp.]MDD3004679.1 A/G-specific adenine glycosylase [Flavobacterium sp.]
MNFSKQLTKWYLQNKRDLPWRKTQNPYLIWLSEIMLQQTRVAQGLPYYNSFVTVFPTVFDLANASEEQVLKLWQGLGYYSRARNMHQTAQFIVNNLKGEFPNSYKELLQLKGVGDYTAAAIASFSFGEKIPVVDGNVFRVLSRVFEIEKDISNSGAKKEFQELAICLMENENPALFNQAIMEFGALQCVPKNPSCQDCVFNTSCLAFKNNKVEVLPYKSKKVKVVDRFFNYLIFVDEQNKTIVEKRTQKGIWHNLYQFPLLETSGNIDMEEVIQSLLKKPIVANSITSVQSFQILPYKHKLSHQNLSIQFWKLNVTGVLADGKDFYALKELPFPIIIYNFIENELLQ